MKKLNLLVSAYACNPLATEESYPGEAILGWNLVKQLSRQHDLTVITRTYNRVGIESAIQKKEIKDISFCYLTLPRSVDLIKRSLIGFSLYYLFWQIKAYFLAKRLMKTNDYDAFHHITFNNDWMPSFIGAYLPLPFIWGPMGGGQRVPSYLKKEMSLRSRIRESIRERGQEFWRKTPFRKRCVKRAAAILVCNQDTRVKIKCPDEKIHFFPVNGISTEELKFASLAPAQIQNNFHVVYAGRLDGIKGLSMGIRAFHAFSQKYPEAKFELIGIGPERERLEKLVVDLELDGRIVFTDWLAREELFRKFAESDVLLFPSMRDGGGAVIIEAMACGKPVIGLDIGGPGFHIQDRWGIKIEPKDVDCIINEMAEALETLFLSKDLRTRMGKAGQKRAEDYYLWEKLGDKLVKIYEQALN